MGLKIMDLINDNLINNQFDYPDFHGPQPFVDIHCHCLPGVDDGPVTMAESIALCRRLAEDGVCTVVATPHQLGRFRKSGDSEKIRSSVSALNEALSNEGTKLDVLPGSEIHVDEDICQLLREDKIMTLADGGRYILLELPHQVSVDITPLIAELASMNVRCIVSHVERIASFVMQRRILLNWIEHSVHLQVTASSLIGDFGPSVQKAAWNFLKWGWIALVATDSHNTSLRRPRMRAAFQSIVAQLGRDVANLVCIENPSRVIKGRDIAPAILYDLEEVER